VALKEMALPYLPLKNHFPPLFSPLFVYFSCLILPFGPLHCFFAPGENNSLVVFLSRAIDAPKPGGSLCATTAIRA